MNKNQDATAIGGTAEIATAPPDVKPTKSPAAIKRDEVKDLLQRHKGEILQALPKHITPDRMIRVALTAINTNPDLLSCTTSSLMGCIMQAAMLGLMPDGAIGEGYLVPFNNNNKIDNRGNPVKECQFIPGYRGLITLAYRSGQIISLQGRAVYKNDHFKYSFGLEEILEHTPADGDRGDLTHVYAVVRMKNGGHVFDVMTKDDIEDVRRMSKSDTKKASSPWFKYYDEMAIKSVIRKIAKRTPLSPELVQAVNLEERVMLLGESQESSLLLLDSADPEMKEVAEGEFQDSVDNASNNESEKLSGALKNESDKITKSRQATKHAEDLIDQKNGGDKAGKESAK